jgi:hypothetical protein
MDCPATIAIYLLGRLLHHTRGLAKVAQTSLDMLQADVRPQRRQPEAMLSSANVSIPCAPTERHDITVHSVTIILLFAPAIVFQAQAAVPFPDTNLVLARVRTPGKCMCVVIGRKPRGSRLITVSAVGKRGELDKCNKW